MKRRTHGGEEGYLLILPVFGDAKFFLAQIGNIVSFSADGDNGDSDIFVSVFRVSIPCGSSG